MLKSAKTGQYLGILERSGQDVLHLFDYSFNRSRELVFIKSPGDKAGTWKFLNLASGMFIGRVSKVRMLNNHDVSIPTSPSRCSETEDARVCSFDR